MFIFTQNLIVPELSLGAVLNLLNVILRILEKLFGVNILVDRPRVGTVTVRTKKPTSDDLDLDPEATIILTIVEQGTATTFNYGFNINPFDICVDGSPSTGNLIATQNRAILKNEVQISSQRSVWMNYSGSNLASVELINPDGTTIPNGPGFVSFVYEETEI